LVEAHGGTLSVSSRLGEGTTVRIVLPIHPPLEPAAGAASLAIGSSLA
jgi:signal transduction histidine kinase